MEHIILNFKQGREEGDFVSKVREGFLLYPVR